MGTKKGNNISGGPAYSKVLKRIFSWKKKIGKNLKEMGQENNIQPLIMLFIQMRKRDKLLHRINFGSFLRKIKYRNCFTDEETH